MIDSPVTDNRTNILNAALEVFSEKGFDGSRVDDIAKVAQVNKALIYYYFSSKKELLLELFNIFIKEAMNIAQCLKNINPPDFLQADSFKEYYKSIFERHLTFFNSHKNIIKLMLMESLKNAEEKNYLLKFFDIFVKEEMDIFSNLNIEIGSNNVQRLVLEFFTMTIPSLWFSVYKNEWFEYYNTDRKTLEEYFLEAIWNTHISYHYNTNLKKE